MQAGFDQSSLMSDPKLKQMDTMNQGNMVSQPYFQANKTKPNFISNKKTISKSTYILKESSNLNNKIILIENADPGYDWLFSKGISGLITKYGGANSHMAIRSAEIGIPAAIGVGEILFDKLKSYKMIELDSLNKVIRKA